VKIRLARGSRDRPASGPAGHGRLGCQTLMPGLWTLIGDSFRDRASDMMAADRNKQSVIS